MKKFILWLARPIIIKNLRNKSFGRQFINTVLEALELPQTGVPNYEAPPPPPPVQKEIIINDKLSAEEALNQSYIPIKQVFWMIKQEIFKSNTVLPYILISKETAEELRACGYEVSENLGGSHGIQKGVSTIRWGASVIKKQRSSGRGNSNIKPDKI